MASQHIFRSTGAVGSGFAHLHTLLASNDVSERSKQLLGDLLAQEGIDTTGERGHTAGGPHSHSPTIGILDSTMSDSTIASMASRGEISLFCSILSVIENAGGAAVTSKRLLQTCALAVPPLQTPGLLDAREMVLAILHFLSQELGSDAALLHLSLDHSAPSLEGLLPLIRPLSTTGDLERRSYEKCYGWALNDIIQQVATLECYFLRCGENYKWLPRSVFLPAIPKAKSQLQVPIKGRVEMSEKRVVKQGETDHEQRIQSSSTHTVAAEATRIMVETNNTDSP